MTYVEVVRREADRVVALLRDGAALDAAVPDCAGWTSYDLVTHLGGVHRWAAAATHTPPDGRVPASHEPQGLRADALADWFAEGADVLVSALADDPDRPCWALWPVGTVGTVGFWRRRQAHETTVHRWDLETALGLPAVVDDDLALDGIDEVLTVMLPRQLHLGRVEPTPAWVRLIAGDRELVLATGEDRDPVPLAAVSGSAPGVLLALWGRTRGPGLDVVGDEAGLRAFLARPLVP